MSAEKKEGTETDVSLWLKSTDYNSSITHENHHHHQTKLSVFFSCQTRSKYFNFSLYDDVRSGFSTTDRVQWGLQGRTREMDLFYKTNLGFYLQPLAVMDAQVYKLLRITTMVFMTQIKEIEINQITHGVSFLLMGTLNYFNFRGQEK